MPPSVSSEAFPIGAPRPPARRLDDAAPPRLARLALLPRARAVAASTARAHAFAETAGGALALGTMASLGALWGAYLLVRIAAGASFTSIGIHEVNAHGHAQVLGWVGGVWMAVMLGAIPRRRGLAGVAPRRLVAIVGVFGVGVAARSIEGAWAATSSSAFLVASAGVLLGLGALGAAWRAARPVLASHRAASDPFLVGGSIFLLLAAVLEGAHFLATTLAPDRAALLHVVATWQAPLRDVQIHGFGLLFGLGLLLEFLLPREGAETAASAPLVATSDEVVRPVARWPRLRFGAALRTRNALVLVLLAEIGGFLLMRAASYRWAIVWEAAVVALLVVVVRLLRATGAPVCPWRATTDAARWLAVTHLWLLASLAMLVVLPAYQFGVLPHLAPASEAVALGFSHAYYGAVRHAITVGWLSQLLALVLLREARLPFAPLVLLNVGCLLRVAGQVATDVTPHAFLAAGVSGFLEWTAFLFLAASWWAGRRRASQCASRGAEGDAPPVAPGAPHVPPDSPHGALARRPAAAATS